MPNGGLRYTSGREPHQTGEPWHLSCHGGKTPAKLHVSRAAPRPMGAEWGAGGHPPCQTGEPWHLSCHGGKTPASRHVSRAAPRPMGAEWGAGGHPPCQTREPRGLSPSGGKTPANGHVPRAAPRPAGAEWSAGVLPLLLPGAVAAVAGLELPDAFVQVGDVKVRPELFREKKLRIGALEK